MNPGRLKRGNYAITRGAGGGGYSQTAAGCFEYLCQTKVRHNF